MIEQITVFALILAMVILWISNYLMFRQWKKERKVMEAYKKWIMQKVKKAEEKAEKSIEQRCQHCTAGPECPGYNTGVIYPCEHYEEGTYGTEK